ncbi:MAG TPA: RnfABCDGE type electron transport complex subunit D [Clostridiales bacterium]|jgi:electron transport complex protein RnfD|nr:RnfABCDGE type electron transport complex subunit D [Clostridiales bacterium]
MNKLIVSSSPHILSKNSIQRIMLDVIIALMPALVAAIIFFGHRALVITIVSVAAAVLTEAVLQKLCKKPVTVNDLSAVVSGILIAFNLPVSVPLWMPVVGSVFAMALVKFVFGGLGHNFMNPALAARALLTVSWPARMAGAVWTQPGNIDVIGIATPLELLKAGENLPGIYDLFMGNVAGCLGETSALALLIGGIYLLLRGVINWRTPVTFIGSVALISWIFGVNPLYSILAGGLMLGALFMATDYATAPVTPKGQLIMGVGCGVITTFIRLFGGYPEGVSYSILFMNVMTPLIDKFTMPKKFGGVKTHA